MKFVNSLEDIKPNYLYEIRDQKRKKNIIITRIERWIITLDVMNNKVLYNKDVLSCVKETDLKFVQTDCYAFYEIGHKDQCPEYFI